MGPIAAASHSFLSPSYCCFGSRCIWYLCWFGIILGENQHLSSAAGQFYMRSKQISFVRILENQLCNSCKLQILAFFFFEAVEQYVNKNVMLFKQIMQEAKSYKHWSTTIYCVLEYQKKPIHNATVLSQGE